MPHSHSLSCITASGFQLQSPRRQILRMVSSCAAGLSTDVKITSYAWVSQLFQHIRVFRTSILCVIEAYLADLTADRISFLRLKETKRKSRPPIGRRACCHARSITFQNRITTRNHHLRNGGWLRSRLIGRRIVGTDAHALVALFPSDFLLTRHLGGLFESPPYQANRLNVSLLCYS